jgi:hypothetical protein
MWAYRTYNGDNSMHASSTIYQPSDLNRRGRVILDAARDGLARIRDTDGASLVVTREEEFEAMRGQLEEMQHLTEAMASFIVLDRAVDHEHREPSLVELGPWTWLRHLPKEDAMEFISDIGTALYESCRAMSAAPLAATLDDWKATAEALSDSLARETLLGESTADDYVEAARPEPAADEAAVPAVAS